MVLKVAQNSLNSHSLSVTLQSDLASALGRQLELAVQQLSDPKFTCSMMPLHRLANQLGVVYRSAIAFKLTPVWQLPTQEIAAQILTAFEVESDQRAIELEEMPLLLTGQTPPELLLNFQVAVVAPGWIDFRLTNTSLAVWLQNLTNADSGLVDSHLEPRHCFSVQYAHARCCSILNLAAQQGLIVLKAGQVIEPYPIPWLDHEFLGATGLVKLRFEHQSELQLIDRFWEILAWDNWDESRKLQEAIALAQDFETFYKHCRIWGAVKTETPQLAQARLGLVAVTRQLLRSQQNALGIPAPGEL